jgi:hypothetical protein
LAPKLDIQIVSVPHIETLATIHDCTDATLRRRIPISYSGIRTT